MEEIKGTYVYTYLIGMVYTHLLSVCGLMSLDLLRRRRKKSSLKTTLPISNRIIRDKLALVLQSE